MTSERYPYRLVHTAEDGTETTVVEYSHDPRPNDAIAREKASTLMDLDRCEHGRHEGDECFGCGGPSRGNPRTDEDRVLGYDVSGNPIRLG